MFIGVTIYPADDSIKAAGLATVSAGAASAIGSFSPFQITDHADLWKYGLHGASQGLIEIARDGSFHQGFIAGLVGHASGQMTGGIDNDYATTVIAATMGGISSAAVGGDFLQRALTAATVHMSRPSMAEAAGNGTGIGGW